MRTASLAAVAGLFLAATPAFATSSIHCRTRGGPDIWLTVPDERGAGISDARIAHGREEIVTGGRGRARIAQSVVNRQRLSLRIVPFDGWGPLVSLTATKRGVPYVGTVVFRGRNWPVRCYWDEDDPE